MNALQRNDMAADAVLANDKVWGPSIQKCRSRERFECRRVLFKVPGLCLQKTWQMLRQIAPLFFTTNIPATLTYYRDKLGFECLGMWQDPPVYAIVARDQQVIHFRCAEPPAVNPDKYRDELLDVPVRRRCRRTLR